MRSDTGICLFSPVRVIEIAFRASEPRPASSSRLFDDASQVKCAARHEQHVWWCVEDLLGIAEAIVGLGVLLLAIEREARIGESTYSSRGIDTAGNDQNPRHRLSRGAHKVQRIGLGSTIGKQIDAGTAECGKASAVFRYVVGAAAQPVGRGEDLERADRVEGLEPGVHDDRRGASGHRVHDREVLARRQCHPVDDSRHSRHRMGWQNSSVG